MAINFLNNATAITAAAGDNSTKIATTAYVDAAAAAVPVGDYLPLAGGTMAGNINMNSRKVYNISELILGTNAYITSPSQYLIRFNQASVEIPSGANSQLGHLTVGSTLTVGSIDNVSSDTDKFLVSDSGIIKYRTGAQLLSDIGAAPAAGGAYLPLSGGTLTGALTGTSATFTGNVNLSANKHILIGTDSGDAFNGDSAIRIQDNGNAFVQVKVGDTSAGGFLVGNTTDDFLGGFIYSNSTESLTFTTANSLALTITGAGNATLAGKITVQGTGDSSFASNVGIGTTSPDSIFEISQAQQNGAVLKITNPTLQNGTVEGGTAQDFGQLGFVSGDSSTGQVNLIRAGIKGIPGETAYSTGGELQFQTMQTYAGTAPLTALLTRMVINAEGNVGIGTTSPSTELHVKGSSTVANFEGTGGSVFIGLKDSDDGTIGYMGVDGGKIKFQTSGSGYSDKLVIDTVGNVGIGTTSPDAKLEVAVGVNSLKISGRDTYIDSSIDSANANIYVTQAGAGDFGQLAGSLVLQARTQGTVYRDIIFAGGLTSGDALMTIQGEGNVGIGTTSPLNTLHISAAAGSARVTSTAGGANLFLESIAGNLSRVRWNGLGNFAIRDDADSQDRLVIDTSGNVGIGTTSPDAKLEVSSTALASGDARYELLITEDNTASAGRGGGLAFSRQGTIFGGIKTLQNTSSNDNTTMYFQTRGGGTVANRMVIDELGNVGIGTASPTKRLEISENGNGTSVEAIFRMIGTNTAGSGSNVSEIVSRQAVGGAAGESAMDLRVRDTADAFASPSTIMTLEGGGNVGIGTTSPTNKLVVRGLSSSGDASANNVAQFEGPSGTNGFQVFVNDANNNTGIQTKNGDDFLINPLAGDVGIGTDTPGAKLEVNSGATNVTSIFKSSDNQAWISIQDNDSGTYGALIGTDTDAGNDFVIANQSAVKTFVINNGNVGIGTTSPQARLDINTETAETNKVRINGEVNWQKRLEIRHYDASELGLEKNMAFIASKAGNKATLGHINSSATDVDVLTWTQDGNVGIGVTDPIYELEVQGEAGIELYNGTGGGNVLNFRPSLGDADKYNLSISSYDHSGGGVGPADGLSINGFDGVSFATGSSTLRQERMRITSAGVLVKQGNSTSARILPGTDTVGFIGQSNFRWNALYASNGTIQTSDVREKEEIKPTQLGLDFVNDLNPVSYKWIDNERLDAGKDKRNHQGLIAQEVAKTLEKHGVDKNEFGGLDIQKTDKYDDFHGMSYEQLLAPMIKAIQELTTKVERLEANK